MTFKVLTFRTSSGFNESQQSCDFKLIEHLINSCVKEKRSQCMKKYKAYFFGITDNFLLFSLRTVEGTEDNFRFIDNRYSKLCWTSKWSKIDPIELLRNDVFTSSQDWKTIYVKESCKWNHWFLKTNWIPTEMNTELKSKYKLDLMV